MTDIFIVAGVRTAVGAFGGALKDTSPSVLIAAVAREAVRRAGVAAEAVGLAVVGQVIPTEPRDMYISRVAVLEGGLGQETPALTVNRLCGSGLQAILTAANAMRAGEAEVALAGGVESMSRAPYHVPAARWGQKMGDTAVIDTMLGALNDPFHRIHMGITAENLAASHGITRAQQDALALESHRRASAAIRAGRFKEQILGIEVRSGKGTVVFDTDEHVRHDARIEDLAALRPAFQKDGTVTAGNASGVNDGAAAVVLATGEAVRRPGAGDAPGLGAGGAGRGRSRRDRGQRGFRRAGLRGGAGSRLRSGAGEPERVGDFARPSGGGDRGDHYGKGGL